MRHDRDLNCIYGAVIAFLLSFGTVGAMVTGLGLEVTELARLGWLCGIAALGSGLCFRFKRGGTVLLCLLALVCWWVWRQEQPYQQLLYMLHRITGLYDSAYGWGIPRFMTVYRDAESMIYPVASIGVAAAVSVGWTVCRRKRIGLALLAAGIPFASCFVVTDTVPRATYLYLWLLGLLLLVFTGGTRRRNLAQGNDLTTMAAVPAALALGLLFLAVPQAEYGKRPEELQDTIVSWFQKLPELMEETSEEIVSALDGSVQAREVSLDSLGPRRDMKYPVMEVTAPVGGTLYLRGQDYDTYTGTDWTAARRRLESFPENVPDTGAGRITIRTRRVRDVLYLPYYSSEPADLIGGSVENSQNEKEYSFDQRTLPENWRAIVDSMARENGQTVAGAASLEYQTTLRYLLLPKATNTWAREMLGQILTDRSSATAIADSVGKFVRNSAVYDLKTAKMSSKYDDFAQWFLEESDTGYCVHFATAATVLLRAAGVEARYVEGYMTTAAAGETVTVTADQAHAWAEYYEPLLGTWIVLEATPADLSGAEETVPPETEPERVTRPSEITAPTAPRSTEAPEETTSAAFLGGGEGPAVKIDLSWLWTGLKWLLTAAALAAAVELQRKLRLELRQKQCRSGEANARALARWRELTRLWALLKEKPSAEAEALAQKAKYSRHSLTGEELGVFDACLEDARRKLRARPWYRKLIDKYIFAAY